MKSTDVECILLVYANDHVNILTLHIQLSFSIVHVALKVTVTHLPN